MQNYCPVYRSEEKMITGKEKLLVDSIMIEKGYTKNKNWVTKKYFDEDHNEDYWRARFHIPIDFFFN